LFLLGHRIGTEQATIVRANGASELRSHFEYLDRGATIALDTTLAFADDFTPLSFTSRGKSYRYFSVDASVPKASGAPNTFTLDGMAPIAAQGLLLRYWLAHGRPAAIALEPSGDRVTIRERKPIFVTHSALGAMRVYTIDGFTWGRQRLWLTEKDLRVVAATTTVGVLGFEAVDAALEPTIASVIRTSIRERLAEAAVESRAVTPVQRDAFALVGGRLIDGTGAAPIENATIVVRRGKIAAAGAADAVTIPAGVPRVEVRGQTVLPGLWDMHAHAGIAEWGPVYLAAGVTTVRDMGGEMDVAVALRDAWRAGRALGPRLLLAGLVDGPGPGSFGHVTAANPAEGRAVVSRYKAAGFQQMKLYSLLDRPTVSAVIEAAHRAGMTVTGHIPNGLTLREVVDLGMDHVAHLAVRGAPGSDELRETIAFLKAKGTVIDPTISWSEMLGRSPQTPLASIQPGIVHLAPSLRRLLESASGSGTPEQARERLNRSLQIIKALHDAGVPIVAGTDKGVPGVSVAREIELYAEAGLTPMEAIGAATAVPARVMNLARDSGTIAPGLRADLIVVEGNPLARIADIRNVTVVSANGRLYRPEALRRLSY
jgi:imidazolonepropionase-like amidohydrolase